MQINIIEYLEKNTLFQCPDRTAVIDGERSLTFLELNRFSKVLANRIIKTDDSINKPIAVYLPKSAETVISDLAIIYSGNIYTNLDVKSPPQRILNILTCINPSLIITNETLLNSLLSTGVDKERILLIETAFENNDEGNNDHLISRLNRIIDTDPLCIINTSGSTGTPKGVVLNHRSFIDFTEWAIETLKIGDNEIIGSLSPAVFDIYSFELCMLMSKGSTIVLIPDTLAAFPITILQNLEKAKVSFIFWVPTIMVNIANMDLLDKISLPDLKTVWFAGEVFPTKQFNYWRKHFPNSKFVNLYGPIEITLDCTYFIVDREISDDEPIPIGFPCKNTNILILNDEDKIAGTNELGELCVRGSSLAMGYYNNPEKTSAAFVRNPLNNSYPEIIYRTGDQVFVNDRGEIIFKGRKDSLIKHLGYRIELSEIEHVIINTLKLVENGCVVYNFGKKEIVLFYESNDDIPIAEMRKTILSFFPKYMIPSIFIKIDELPRNVNGKIDRLLLQNQINIK
jgi:amino acid adenylation domain-containing protein